MRTLPLLLLVAVLAAGCSVTGGPRNGKTVHAAPRTVVGTLPKAAKGNAAAGKAVFASNGCSGCHTYKPAGSKGNVGPDLDNVERDAQKANHGSVEEYVAESIKDPAAYVVPGFPNGVMPSYAQLGQQKVADLVAFLTQQS